MRNPRLLAALLVILSVYGLVNYYLFRRGWQALAGLSIPRALFAAVFLAAVLSYPLGRMVFGFGKNGFSRLFVEAGAFYLAWMIYLLLGVLLVDLVRAVNALWPFFPKSFAAAPQKVGPALFLLVAVSSGLVVLGGFVNAARPRIRELNLAIDKPAGSLREITVVMASDLHLGLVSGSSRLKAAVARINALRPDIVLFPGDIVDESVTAREEEDMNSDFMEIRAPLGVFSVPGNHEYYGGLEPNLAFLRKSGVRVLEDEAVKVAGAFYVIGRRDPTAVRRGEKREGLAEIMTAAGVDSSLPLILLDHQPVHLEQAEAAGIDLQLSGHTHAGQLFPLNLINKRIYEQYWGYWRRGKTQYYISCGVGTWGPPVRTGSVPEIVRIHLTFRTSAVNKPGTVSARP